MKNGDRSVNFLWPEDISAHRDGILFTDVHDYDGDDQDELLVLRRQRGMVNVKTGDWVYAQERSDYIFEMYEYSQEKKECALSGRFIAGVFDEFNLFMARNGAGIFRRDNDGKSEIIVETFKEEQDHPHVICLMRLGYNGKNFNNASGFRYGALFWGDQNVQFQQFKTLEAYGLLSSNSSMDDAVEVIAAADKEADEAVSSALEKGLAAMQTTGSIAALERERDDYLLSLVKDHKYDALTMYPVYGYYFAREREAKAVRLIMTVKRNGLDDAVIQERLCDLYG